MSTTKSWITQKGMRWAFWTMVILLILIIVLCIIFYPEPYRFFSQTISSLGHVYSIPTHIVNTTSQWIFTGGFGLLAIGTLVMIIGYLSVKGFYGTWIKVIMLLIFFLGCIGTAFPADHPNTIIGTIHMYGAAFFVSGFGLFNFVAQLLRYIRKHVPKPTEGKRKADYYLDLTFVILTFIGVIWYLLSGLLVDILGYGADIFSNGSEWFYIFNTEFSQKILLFIGVIAAFLLDVDDM